QVKKELLRFGHTFLVLSFSGQLISLVTFVLNVNFSFAVGDTVYYYGIYDGRLWGFYSNPNAASFYAVLCFMLMCLCILIQKGNVPRGWKIFYWVSTIVELLVFFLCNSRTSLLVACVFLVLFPLLMTIPEIVRVWGNKKERGARIRRLAAICIIAPLALLGAHEYAIDLLPNFVIQSSTISEQLTESLETYSGGEVSVSSGLEGSGELERSNYGTRFGGRYYLWRAGVEIVKNAPLFGVGNDNVPTYAYRYAARYYTNFGQSVYLPGVTGGLHNLFFQLAAASGLVGMGIFVLFCVLLVIRSIRYYIWMIKNDRVNKVAIVCFCIVVITLLRTMTDTGIVYGLYYLGVIFWTALSGLMYFMDTEYTAGRRPVGAVINDFLFHRSKDRGMPKLKLTAGQKRVRQREKKRKSKPDSMS
ncbi:MAG: O-antigen ligase family protein, partial [Oscillospiraceae bacterium]|nr:O-antigen ligase family protein [Oscillospiraceae bacterium]